MSQQPAVGSWERRVIGQSRHQRAITAESYAPAASRAAEEPVVIIGCIHGDEPEGLAALGVVRAEIEAAQRRVVLVENMNPDGEAESGRGNAAGVDLNRNWPTANFRPSRAHGPSPLSEPETQAVFKLMEDARPSLVIVLHSARSGPFVNFDGPAEDLAARFADAAQKVDGRWRAVPDMGYPTPGSLGTLIGRERGVPILTIEFRRGQAPDSVRSSLAAGLRAVLRAATAAPQITGTRERSRSKPPSAGRPEP